MKAEKTTEMRVKLEAGQFHINDRGELVIKDDEMAKMVREAMESKKPGSVNQPIIVSLGIISN